MGLLVNALAGLLFGLGLLISGMADPAKVQNFLDVFGTWDPSLAFVMAGAVTTAFVGYRFSFRRPAPLLSPQFVLPASESRSIAVLCSVPGCSASAGASPGSVPGPPSSRFLCLRQGRWSSFQPCSAALRSPAPCAAAVRAGVILPPMLKIIGKVQRVRKAPIIERAMISRKSNIEIAISSLLTLSHPA